MPDTAIVFDCGATNVRAVAVDAAGQILAAAGAPNAPVSAGDGGLIWDLDELWDKLAAACQEVCAQVPAESLRAVTVTTFGTDGTPVDSQGRQTYPLISWQDDRTADLADRLAQDPGGWLLFHRTGYQIITFNKLLRLMLQRQESVLLTETMNGVIGLPARQKVNLLITSLTKCHIYLSHHNCGISFVNIEIKRYNN